MVFVYITEGFEEIEALTPVDVLRRADIEVATVSMEEQLYVRGAHDIEIACDMTFHESEKFTADMLVLPGGMPGTMGLAKSEQLLSRIRSEYEKGTWVCAICAAPLVLAKAGILKGKNATIYPGMEKEIEGAIYSGETVCVDGNIITSRGPGTALPFAFALVAAMAGKESMDSLKRSMVVHA